MPAKMEPPVHSFGSLRRAGKRRVVLLNIGENHGSTPTHVLDLWKRKEPLYTRRRL